MTMEGRRDLGDQQPGASENQEPTPETVAQIESSIEDTTRSIETVTAQLQDPNMPEMLKKSALDEMDIVLSANMGMVTGMLYNVGLIVSGDVSSYDRMVSSLSVMAIAGISSIALMTLIRAMKDLRAVSESLRVTN